MPWQFRMELPFWLYRRNMNNSDSIKTVKGVGSKTAELFNELGIFTVDDLVRFYPFRYEPYEKMISIEEIVPDTNVAVLASIKASPRTIRTRKLKITEAVIEDYSGKIGCVWYNSPFVISSLDREKPYVFCGKAVKRSGRTVIEHPIIYKEEDYRKLSGGMKPVYRSVKGLSQKTITKAIGTAIERYSFNDDYLPVDIRVKYSLKDNITACKEMHFPKNSEMASSARRRIVFDEFFGFIYTMSKLKDLSKRKTDYPIDTSGIYEDFASKLPFTLTEDQNRTIDEIFNDLNAGKTINRLIQGDVGSGKTIIAVLMMYAAFRSGYQSVIMVPTEVLANQHYKTILSIFDRFDCKPSVSILTGSLSQKEKNLIHEKAYSGESDIIVGTHALIQDSVRFRNAAVVITDEQHRFGVKQREALSEGSKTPHVLVMSATPIPRTLAVILYGDLDISMILSKPEGRLPVKNAVIKASDRGKAYRTILDQINAGHQAYIICPMVEESDAIDAENVIDYTSKIKSIFPENIVVQFLHGRMSQEEKNNIMCSFSEGHINILVSTTVVEVGVDVPNATVMMIENAERFGLATLHQLRGRVGRGKNQSYCIFVHTNDSVTSRQRLDVVGKSNDGFYIASEDLRLRGPGELLGQMQSGDMTFGIADIYSDADILAEAKDCSDYISSDEFRPDDDEAVRLAGYLKEYTERFNKLNI